MRAVADGGSDNRIHAGRQPDRQHYVARCRLPLHRLQQYQPDRAGVGRTRYECVDGAQPGALPVRPVAWPYHAVRRGVVALEQLAVEVEDTHLFAGRRVGGGVEQMPAQPLGFGGCFFGPPVELLCSPAGRKRYQAEQRQQQQSGANLRQQYAAGDQLHHDAHNPGGGVGHPAEHPAVLPQQVEAVEIFGQLVVLGAGCFGHQGDQAPVHRRAGQLNHGEQKVDVVQAVDQADAERECQ